MTALTAIRLVLLFDAAGWSFVLSRPGRTFSLSRAYDGMAAAMGEDAWAGLFAAFALGLAVTWRVRWPRAAMVFALGVLHAWMALSFGRHSGWIGAGAVTQSEGVLLAWWLLGEDLRQAGRRARRA